MSASTHSEKIITPSQSFLDHERRAHEAFAVSRRRVYVRQSESLEKINRFVDEVSNRGRGGVLLATGSSGAGKSALLANWAYEHRQLHPEDFIIEHYIGASSRGSTHIDLIRRLMMELNERFEISGSVPATASAVEEEFSLWLAKINDRTLFVLDGLDQLEDGSDCSWIPEYLPGRVTIIASARTSVNAFYPANDNWTELELMPLSRSDRQEIVRRHLPASLEGPIGAHLDQITSHAASTNALFLCTGAATVWSDGSADVTDRIDRYLAANDLDDLFEQILVRIEEKNGVEDVRNVVVPLCIARRGLTLSELRDVAGKKAPNFDSIVSALDLHTIHRNDIITFSHEKFRTCASERYLTEPGAIRDAHKALAQLFASHPSSARTADEAPWHWMRAEKWKLLVACLCDRNTLHHLSADESQFDLLRYWRAIGDRFDAFEQYNMAVERWVREGIADSDLSKGLEEIGSLLTKQGRYDEALNVFQRALAIREAEGNDGVELARILHQLGELLYYSGSLLESERYMRRALDILDSTTDSNRDLRALCIGDLAALLLGNNQVAEAERLLISSRNAAEKNGDTKLIAECLNNLGTLYCTINKLDRAEEMFRTAIKLNSRALSVDHPVVAFNMLNLAKLEMQKGDLRNAESTSRAALSILDAVLGASHPQTLNGRALSANIIFKSGNHALAEQLLIEVVQEMRRRTGDDLRLATTLANLGSILKYRGETLRARMAYGECVAIRTKHLGESHPDTMHAREAEKLLARSSPVSADSR